MEEFLGSLAWPSALAWGAFAFGAAFALIAQTHGHVRQAFHRRRLERRLARDPYMLREEMKEYQLAIGGNLEPVQREELIARSLAAGLVYAVPAWLLEIKLDHWFDYAHWGLIAFGLLFGLWRWLNDPRDIRQGGQEDEADEEPGYVPREAGIDFVSAIVVVIVILLIVGNLF